LDILPKRYDPENIKSDLGIIFDANKKSSIFIKQIKSAPTPDDKQEVDMTALPVKYDR